MRIPHDLPGELRARLRARLFRVQLDVQQSQPACRLALGSIAIRSRFIGIDSADASKLTQVCKDAAQFAISRVINEDGISHVRSVVRIYFIGRDHIPTTPEYTSYKEYHARGGGDGWWSRRAQSVILIHPMKGDPGATIVHEISHALMDPYPMCLCFPKAIFEGYAIVNADAWRVYNGCESMKLIWHRWYDRAQEYNCAYSLKGLCALDPSKGKLRHPWYQSLFRCQSALLVTFLLSGEENACIMGHIARHRITGGEDAADALASLIGVDLSALEYEYAQYAAMPS